MLIFLILGIILVAGILMWNLCDYEGEEVGEVMAIASGVILVILLIMLPILRYGSTVDVAEFRETVLTIGDARSNPDISEFELAALQREIIESNRWLVENQKWAKTKLVGWFYHSSILELERIK